MSEFSTILFEVEQRVATITLNRPERLNAMNQAMKDDLRAAWTFVRDDPEIWACIITGTGRAFSSGADVESLASGGFRKIDRFRELAMIENIRVLPTPRRMGVMKPVIAAVNGLVNGVSLDLVTEADIPIASEKAQFLIPTFRWAMSRRMKWSIWRDECRSPSASAWRCSARRRG